MTAVTKAKMDRKTTRWWVAEVGREYAANDNMNWVEWNRMWDDVASQMRENGWREQEMAVRQMQAVARQSNKMRRV